MDHYRTLKVGRTATTNEIEKAYKKLALKHHPDKSDAPDAAEKFRTLNEAYEVLKDETKRKFYDQFDLPRASVSSRSHHYDDDRHSSRHHRTNYDDSFYTGRSETHRKEQEHRHELDRIRAINKKLLEEANAKLHRASSKGDKRDSANRSNSGIYSHIEPDLTDEKFEKKVLDRLRSVAGI